MSANLGKNAGTSGNAPPFGTPPDPNPRREDDSDMESDDAPDWRAEFQAEFQAQQERVDQAFGQRDAQFQQINANNVQLQAQLQQQARIIQQLQALLDQQNAGTNTATVSNPPRENRQRELGEILKPTPPEMFDGNPKKLQTFLTEMRAHFNYFETSLATPQARVHFAATRLTGTPRAWFEPTLGDYVKNFHDGVMNERTIQLFNNYEEFEKALKQTFGTVNEEREAETQLNEIQQKGACSEHSAKFVQIASKVKWDQTSLINAYYQSLKSDIKDELVMKDRPKTLVEFIEMAVKIDDRLYARRKEKHQEKRGNSNYGRTYANQGRKREGHVARSNDGTPGRMDLDKVNHRKFAGKCFGCGKTGHRQAECNSSGKTQSKPWEKVPEISKKQVNMVSTKSDHALMSWTACYDDSCLIHKSDKDGSGYYPKGRHTVNMIRHTTFNPGNREIDEIPVKTTQRSSSPEIPDRQMSQQVSRLLYEEVSPSSSSESSETEDDFTDVEELHPHTGELKPEFLELNLDLMERALTQAARFDRIRRMNHLVDCSLTNPEHGIAIKACTTKQAFKLGPGYQGMREDHPAIHPRNIEHEHISWVTCIDHGCLVHLKDKVEHDAFPIRNAYAEMTKTCLQHQTRDWRVTTRFGSLQIILLAPHPRTPEECRQGKPYQDCTSIHCQIHANHKLDEWTRARRLAQRCGEEQPYKCKDVACTAHKMQKLHQWHMMMHGGSQMSMPERMNRVTQQLFDNGFNFLTHEGTDKDRKIWHALRGTPSDEQCTTCQERNSKNDRRRL